MKIAFVGQPFDRFFPPGQNSIGLILYYTALEIARRAEVSIYGKRHRDDTPPADLPVSFTSFPVTRDRALQKSVRCFPRLARWIGLEAALDRHTQYRREVTRRVARDRPDIVHVMNYWPWCRDLKAQGAAHRLVLEMQCEWLSQRDRDAVDHQLGVVDAVVAVSDHIATTFLAAFPGFPGQVVTVGNGVDVDHFTPAPECRGANGRRRILFVGRISPEKGVHTLLEAFGEIARRSADVELDIAGPYAPLSPDFLLSLSSDATVRNLLRFYDRDGTCIYQAHLDRIIAEHGLGQRVRFLGSLAHKDLVATYQASDIVVNPSLSESFGISVVEGMACGIPVVGTRVGGMCETILDGTTGLLVDPDAPLQLADAMAAILAYPAKSRRMGAEGRDRAVTYHSWQARADRLATLYESLAGNTARMHDVRGPAARPVRAQAAAG